jgi:hypothetical protein
MDVTLDVSAVPLTEEQIQTILDTREALLKEEIVEGKREDVAVATSVAFGEERRFILPGNTQEYKEYESAQAMIADQPPLPDPVFTDGDVVPCTYAAGAQLNCLDAHAADFKGMIEEMFAAGPQLKLTKEGIEEQLEHYQEVNLPMVENE